MGFYLNKQHYLLQFMLFLTNGVHTFMGCVDSYHFMLLVFVGIWLEEQRKNQPIQ